MTYGFRSSNCKFHPSDESIAADLLRPMNHGYDLPAGAPIITDDPYRVEPWKLLAAHEIDVEEGAYFLMKKVMVNSNGVRRKRTVGDAKKIIGTWKIQHCDNGSNIDRVPANEIVRWCKTLLSYYTADNNGTTTGYVMHEYELFKNSYSGGSSEGGRKGETHDYIICRVSLSCREISRRKRERKESAAIAAAASRISTGPNTSSPASTFLFGSGWTNNPHSYPPSETFSASLFEPRTLLAPNPCFAPFPALPSSPRLETLPQPARYGAPLVAADTATALYSAPSFESAHEGALSTCIASSNLNPLSSAISYNLMLQFGNNHAENYLNPNSCIEPPLPSCALPPLSYMLPQPPVAAATVPFETKPQQQPPPALPAAVEGIAEPLLDCNGEADMEMNIDEVFAVLDEETLKGQPQMQQLPLNAFNDNYSNFSNFYIDNGRNDVFAGS